MNSFDLKKLVGSYNKKNVYSSGNTLKIDKKELKEPKFDQSYSTFDDGLLFEFPIEKYEHLTYYCRTSTPLLDTCNVKLFKMHEMFDEK